MKPGPLQSLATHLAGVAAGGALAYVLVAATPDEEEAPPPKHRSTTLAARFGPTTTLELEGLIEDVNAARRAADPEHPLTIREMNLQAIERQRHIDRGNEKVLRRLRAMANTLVETKDLQPTLTDALATGDRDLTRALFLEWHRRDPDAAFDALARRNAWLESIDDILALAIPNDRFIAQIARKDRPDSFRDHLARQLGAKLGASDDLRGLPGALDRVTTRRRALFEGFTRTWIPDNGAEAARFIGLEMKPAHQQALLEALAGDGGRLNPQPWTDEFAASLFDYDLHVPEQTYNKLATNASLLNHARPDPPGSLVEPVDPGMNSDQAVNALTQTLDTALHRQRDYPELFAAGEIDLDEILEVAKEETPGAEHHPVALRRALFLKLAPHNPARAVTWANAAIPRSYLARDIDAFFLRAAGHPVWPATAEGRTATIWTTGSEPRTRRLADLAAVLRPPHLPDLESSLAAQEMRQRIGEWTRLAPDSAKHSINRIDPGHPIRKEPIPETAGP